MTQSSLHAQHVVDLMMSQSKIKLAFVRLSTNFPLGLTICFRQIVCANVAKVARTTCWSETFRAARNVSMLITIYDHDHYDSCSSSNWDSGSGCAASLRCEVFGTTVACRRKNFFLSKSCVRTQPKHPLDRSAWRSSHTIKNFFCATSFAGYQSGWPSSQKLDSQRDCERNPRGWSEVRGLRSTAPLLFASKSFRAEQSRANHVSLLLLLRSPIACGRSVFTDSPFFCPNLLFFHPEVVLFHSFARLGCPEFVILEFQHYENCIFCQKKYKFRNCGSPELRTFRNSVFPELWKLYFLEKSTSFIILKTQN